MTRRIAWLLLVLAAPPVAAPTALAQDAAAVFAYESAPLRDVLADVEARTTYRFLYRDALVGGKRVTLRAAPGDVVEALAAALAPLGVGVEADDERRHVVLFPTDVAARGVVRGTVLDAETGVRLPYATVTWTEAGVRRGVATDDDGAFRVPRAERVESLSVSYIGYHTARVGVPADAAEIAVRLRARDLTGGEVVVTGSLLQTDLDTTWRGLISPDRHAPFGERSVLRALEALPSVHLGGGLSQGLEVRGSKGDGFRVLLDGLTIYNQTHFFGLFDAFNADALQAVGFYYDVTPADLGGAPGGTLAFVTRTGSQTAPRAAAGASNAAVRGTAEGPLWDGRGSWLVSGRRSYLGAVDWFGSGALVEQGMSAGRASTLPPPRTFSVEDRVLTEGATDAHFYDVHGKIYHEGARGGRLTVSAYAGGSAGTSDAERLMQSDAERPGGALVARPVTTENVWRGAAAGAQYARVGTDGAHARLVAGLSRYTGRYRKDDFLYVRAEGDSLRTTARPFSYESDLVEAKLEGRRTTPGFAGGTVATGAAAYLYTIRYDEDAMHRRDFSADDRAAQLDLFAQYDGTSDGPVQLHAGLRSHLYTAGSALRLSPRVRLRLLPGGAVSAGVGASRSYQFLHRLTLLNEGSPGIYVMSGEGAPPTSVDNLSGGVYLRAAGAAVQIEGYVKHSENVRQHEVSVQTRARPGGSLLATPWLNDYRARARGVELLARRDVGRATATVAYARSRVTLANERLDDGRAFAAPWDRRHQLTALLSIPLPGTLKADVTWLWASGAPNELAPDDPSEPERLAPYARLDAALRWHGAVGGATVETRLAAFNVLDRDNPWYRTPLGVVDRNRRPPALAFVNVDVYDLGFQPSFDVTVRF